MSGRVGFLQLGLHTAGGSGSTCNQLEISLVQSFIHPKINSLGDRHEVLLVVALLGSGGETSCCPPLVPSSLPRSQGPIPNALRSCSAVLGSPSL